VNFTQVGDGTKIQVPDRPDATEAPARSAVPAAAPPPLAPAAAAAKAAPPAVRAEEAAAAEDKRRKAVQEAKARLADEQVPMLPWQCHDLPTASNFHVLPFYCQCTAIVLPSLC
jgi:hypothetical protein